MYKLKKLLPLGVLLLSGCNTALDEHQGCSSEPVYIHFTTQNDVNTYVDITTSRSDATPQIGMIGFAYDNTHASLNDIDMSGMREGLKNSPYRMESNEESSYSIIPDEGVATPSFPYQENSAVGIHAYYPYTAASLRRDAATNQWYIPLSLYDDAAQTDWLHCDTVCHKAGYDGSIALNFRHALIRLDIIVDLSSTDKTTYTVKLYTDNNGKARFMLQDGTIEGQQMGMTVDEAGSVVTVEATADAESPDVDTVTFYLLPGTSIYKIAVDDVDNIPHDEDDSPMDKDTLPLSPGTRREIHITYQ